MNLWVFRTVADVVVRYALIVILILLGFVLYDLDRLLRPAAVYVVDEPASVKGKNF